MSKIHVQYYILKHYIVLNKSGVDENKTYRSLFAATITLMNNHFAHKLNLGSPHPNRDPINIHAHDLWFSEKSRLEVVYLSTQQVI